jgi:hypothetical protein
MHQDCPVGAGKPRSPPVMVGEACPCEGRGPTIPEFVRPGMRLLALFVSTSVR